MADAGLFQDEGFTNEQVLKAISSLLPKQYAFFIPSQFELISFFFQAQEKPHLGQSDDEATYSLDGAAR